MKVAIEGCAHGELDAIYGALSAYEQSHNIKVDLLLICGDFQAIRNEQDLACMAVPDKYKTVGGFCKYYSGEKAAPMLTIVIGGNHEASNYMWELFHGGWLAPNIYFLGHAGCVQVNGVRIAGASGIFKHHDFPKGFYERLPYNQGDMRSIYHIREYNVRRLSLLSQPTVFLSHDWPRSIEHYGDLRGLLRRKKFLKEDIDNKRLGSPPLMSLLTNLKPAWWFSAHLHCRYEAQVVHGYEEGTAEEAEEVPAPAQVANPDEITIDDNDDLGEAPAPASDSIATAPVALPRVNPDEILLDDEEEDVAPPPPPPVPVPVRKAIETKFLALGKCLKHIPQTEYIEVVDIPTPDPHSGEPTLTFDPEWLAITRAFNPHMSKSVNQLSYPDEAQARAAVAKELEWVNKQIFASEEGGKGIKSLTDVQSFVANAPVHEEGKGGKGAMKRQPPHQPNPQTAAFCAMLEIDNKID